MNKFPVELIKKIIMDIDLNDLGTLEKIGTFSEITHYGAIKYMAYDSHIKFFVVITATGGHQHICFVCNEEKISFSDVEFEFGVLDALYNWRDNFTEFRLKSSSQEGGGLYFRVDNKINILPNGRFSEVTPQGKTVEYESLLFDRFYIAL